MLSARQGIKRRMLMVLVVENDDVIAEGIIRHLGAAGLKASSVRTAEQGLDRPRNNRRTSACST